MRDPLGGPLLYTFDAKTNERGRIYSSAHVQANMYEVAAREAGDEPADRVAVVVFGANGEFREAAADHPPEMVEAAMTWYRALRPIESGCEAANRAEREAVAA